jgi:hypothetical protein
VTHEADEFEARVDRVFVALGRMSHADLMAMRAAWDTGNQDLREVAWSKVGATLRRDPRAPLMESARARLSTWASEAYNGMRGGAQHGVVVPGGMDEAELRRSIEPPALDAIAAMLLDDVFSDEERDELLEPIRRASRPAQRE